MNELAKVIEPKKERTDLTRYQANFIQKLKFVINDEVLKKIDEDERLSMINRYLNRGDQLPEVHRTNERRIFSILTALPREIRKTATYNGSMILEIDTANSQPLLLVNELINNGYEVEPELKQAVETGKFYETFDLSGTHRDEIKKAVFRFFYSKEIDKKCTVYKQLSSNFPKFLDSFIEFQSRQKDTLATTLQGIESGIWIDGISTACMKSGIEHATIHDSIIFAGRENINPVMDQIHKAFGNITPALHIKTLQGTPIEYEYKKFDHLDKLIQDAKYTIDSEFEQPEPLILIGDYWFGTLGNFSMITGKAKSMKTFFITLIMGFVLKYDNLTGLIQGRFPEGRQNIVIFDTEQAGFHAHKVIQRVKELGGNANRVTGFKLRPLTPQTRLNIIERVIETTHKTTALYIIDGIRDLAQKGINDEETATDLTSKLLEWTDKYKIHIIVVLHQNKKDDNPRGHLGTELVNKAENIVSTTRDEQNQVTMVSCEDARNREFAPFAFEIVDGLPQLTNIPEKESNNSKVNPALVAEKTHRIIIDRIFENRNEYSNDEIRTAIINEFNKIDQGFGTTKAKEFVMYYETNKYIQNVGNKTPTGKKRWVKNLVNEA